MWIIVKKFVIKIKNIKGIKNINGKNVVNKIDTLKIVQNKIVRI